MLGGHPTFVSVLLSAWGGVGLAAREHLFPQTLSFWEQRHFWKQSAWSSATNLPRGRAARAGRKQTVTSQGKPPCYGRLERILSFNLPFA